MSIFLHTGRLPRYISHPFQNCYDGHPSAVAGHAVACQISSSNTRADLLSRAARANASGGEGRGARPRATDEQLVGVGQRVCGLPSRKEDMHMMRGEVWPGMA
eukprot:scaffold45742_cov55-Phaeocystis_antarctica.AAC.1